MKRALWPYIVISLLCASNAQASMTAKPQSNWTLTVTAGSSSKQASTAFHLWVYGASERYKAQIFAIGPYTIPPPFPAAGQLLDIATREPNTMVVNGGPYSSDPFTPAGLLRVAGRTMHPFAFAHSKNGDYRLSAIVCEDGLGKLRFLKTKDFDNSSSTIGTECPSALQAGPWIIENGVNQIRAGELHTEPHLRTILGVDSAGAVYVVIFEIPVQLYIAAEFLRAPQGPKGVSSLVLDGNGQIIGHPTGLGLVQAINLDGDDDSVSFFEGRSIFGNPLQAIPTAIKIQPEAVTPQHERRISK